MVAVDVAQVGVRQVARVPARLGDRARLLGVAAGEHDLVLVAVGQHACERRPPGPPTDDEDLHVRRTKSIDTGTPPRLKRFRNSFSTQYA